MRSFYVNVIKYLFDCIVSVIVLFLLSPILLFLIISLHFLNKGFGIFFTQLRPGKKGKIYKIIKFKSMSDKRDMAGTLLPDKERITRVGKFIRSTSIDKLPQLINVLKVDMSLTGFRPLCS